MKKLLFVALTLFFATTCFAQTQKGYVKTKGRLDNDGNLIPGTPLSEVVVKVKDRNEVMSDKRGDFSFPMPDQTYYLESVAKNGYVLIDPDVLSKQYSYSKNKLVIALETKDQQIEERMDNFRKINEAQNAMITKLRAEVKQLKEENKITEEEYYKRLQEIVDMQNESQKLVEEMVERYSKMDFDQLSEFELQIKSYILSGDLLKAKSMIMSKGDLTERAADLRRHQEANAKERDEIEKRSKKLEKSEALAQKKLEELAKDYYDLFEIYKLEHKNDSAAYYLELRAALDTTNVEWLLETGEFISEYLADFDKATNYFMISLRQSVLQFGEITAFTAITYNNIGGVYNELGNYNKALECFGKALKIYQDLYGPENLELAHTYSNIGEVYKKMGDFDKGLEYYNIARNILEREKGSDDIDVGVIYNNIGTVYCYKHDYAVAISYYQKYLEVLDKLKSNCYDYDIGLAYNNIGMAYQYLKEVENALNYLNMAYEIWINVFGENNPHISTIYNNLGLVYSDMKKKDEALAFHKKSLEIKEQVFGKNSDETAVSYHNIGATYYDMDSLDKAIDYLKESIIIHETIYGENHPSLVYSNNTLGKAYKKLGDYDKAIEHLNIVIYLWGQTWGNDANMAGFHYSIAGAYKEKGDYANAIESYTKSMTINEELFGKNNKAVAVCNTNIGDICFINGDYSNALNYYSEAYEIYKVINGDDDFRSIEIKEKISDVKQKLKESSKK